MSLKMNVNSFKLHALYLACKSYNGHFLTIPILNMSWNCLPRVFKTIGVFDLGTEKNAL